MKTEEKIRHSIELLKKYESLALRYSEKGFFLAFSGGKDSQALYHIAKLAGVRFEAHYNVTTIDPPELVRFIRKQYPDVVFDRPKLSFAKLCIKKKMLPTRYARFCCAELKETSGGGTVTLTGVRHTESSRRKLRGEAEIFSRNKKRRFQGTSTNFDQFTRNKEVENVQCIKGKDKIIINPIIEWSEDDVWEFLNNVVKVQHCELYDKGRTRLGCMFCPMANIKSIRTDCEEYPKYKALIIRTINKLRQNGYMNNYTDLTDEEIFDWWISKKNIKQWYCDNKLQQTLF